MPGGHTRHDRVLISRAVEEGDRAPALATFHPDRQRLPAVPGHQLRDRGAEYVVNFFVRGGQRYGHCNCKAGTYNLAGRHLSAAGLHVMIAAARAEVTRSPERRAA